MGNGPVQGNSYVYHPHWYLFDAWCLKGLLGPSNAGHSYTNVGF